MSPTTNKDGSATLSKELHRICLEVAWEIDAVAEMLLTINGNSTPEDLNAGYKTRCVASRIKVLSSILMTGLSEDEPNISDLEHQLNLTA